VKRSRFWLTMVIAFSLPTLVYAQGTSGCSGNKIIKNGTTKTTGKKSAAHKELARKGSGNAPKTTGNATVPKVENPNGSATGGAGSGRAGKISESGTGRKGKVEPTTSARKKPPSPAPKPPDQK
jgi:hypothetical protein